jgi:hypothetical protein
MYLKTLSLFLFGSAIAIPSTADAQTFDFTPYSGRILSDPAYLPLAGQFEGVTSYDFRDARGISFDATGAEQFKLHQWAQEFTQDVQYGVLDDLTIGGSVQYDPFSEAKHDLVAGGETVRRSSGWADPSFNVTWRALDQDVQPVNLDLFASYSPDWIDAQAATNQDDGTIARGGQAGTIGVALSHVTRSFTIYGSFAADLLGRQRIDNPRTDAFSSIGSRTSYTLALNTQTRFNDVLSLNAGASHVWNDNAQVFNSATDLAHLNEPGDVTDVHVALNYHIVPNMVVASLTYAHDFADDNHNIFPTVASVNDNSLQNRDANIYGAKLYYALP